MEQAKGSVAAGVILSRNQDQARAGRFGLRSAAECVQDGDDGGVRGENAEPNRDYDCEEDDDGHEKRDHDQPTLKRICCGGSTILESERDSSIYPR